MTGSCLCQKIKFKFTKPILFHVHCHCKYCRKAQGAAFATWIGINQESFELSSGNDLLAWYKSSKESERGFCANCGSTMFYKSIISPGELHIIRSYIDDEIEILPKAHIFYDHKVDWFSPEDNLQKINSDHELLSKFKEL